MSDLAGAIGIRAEEQELVRELQSGSEQAFALLIAQYSRPRSVTPLSRKSFSTASITA